MKGHPARLSADKLTRRNPYVLARVVRHYPETHLWVAVYKQVGQWLASYIERLPIAVPNVLEIGSGGGELALAMANSMNARRRAFRMRLVEPSALMRRSRAHKLVTMDPHVLACPHYFPGAHRACSKERYDVVIAVLSFHHLLSWSAELRRLVRDRNRYQIFISGIETGDAVFIGTGRGRCADPKARAFWREYRKRMGQFGIRVSRRPGPLSPWINKPMHDVLREQGFRCLTQRTWTVVHRLTYGEVLQWIADGALTSLLAFGRATDRYALAKHMKAWMSAKGVKTSDPWAYTAGVRFTIFLRGTYHGAARKWHN